jgi:hypothetical protein
MVTYALIFQSKNQFSITKFEVLVLFQIKAQSAKFEVLVAQSASPSS